MNNEKLMMKNNINNPHPYFLSLWVRAFWCLFTFLILTFEFILLSSVQAMTLIESVDMAKKNNPAVLASQKKVDAANAKLNQAVGAFFPNVQLSGNYGYSYSQPSTVQITMPTSQGAVAQTLTFGTDATQKTQGWQASLSQPIFVAALFPGYSIAKKSVDVAGEDLRKNIIEVDFNATKAYFQVLAAERYVALQTESKKMADSHLNQVKAMFQAGVSTQADLLRSEVQSANADVALTKAKNTLELACAAFNNALGRDVEEEVKLTEEGLNTAEAVPAYKELITRALEKRPDWRQFILSKQIGEENVKVAQTGLLPSVVLSGQTGNRVTEYPTFGSSVNSWAVTGAAAWTLFDGLGTENRIYEAAANLEAQKKSEIQLRDNIALEVRDAYLNLKSVIETLASTKKAVDSAEENQKVATLRYNSGVGTNIDVIDAQVALTQAKVNSLQARLDFMTAKAKINKVVGEEIL
jgi:outer membrane protein TolC